MALLMLALGFAGGFAWGVYLFVASWGSGDEGNSAFSAMRIAKYKSFLRIRIDGDELTVYPIAVDVPPSKWIKNPQCVDEDQDTPVFVPATNIEDIGQYMIEEPVVIDIKDVLPLKAVADK